MLRLKTSCLPDLIAKAEYIESIGVLLSQAQQNLLTRLKSKWKQDVAEISMRDQRQLDEIWMLDATRRVHRITAADKHFARDLTMPSNDAAETTPTKKPVDPFSDIGKRMRPRNKSKPRRSSKKKV